MFYFTDYLVRFCENEKEAQGQLKGMGVGDEWWHFDDISAAAEFLLKIWHKYGQGGDMDDALRFMTNVKATGRIFQDWTRY